MKYELEKEKDPLHGVKLQEIMAKLVDIYGWKKLGELIPIRCFTSNPSIQSSLKFLRKTPWARTKVENLYLKAIGRWETKDHKFPFAFVYINYQLYLKYTVASKINLLICLENRILYKFFSQALTLLKYSHVFVSFI